MFHAIPAEAGPHVIRRIILADKVWSFGRVLPREWIPPGARQAIDDQRRAREKPDGRKKNDVVFCVQVARFGNGLGADVVVWYIEVIEGNSPPAFRLRAEPGVNQGDARRANGVRFNGGGRGDRDRRQTEAGNGVVEFFACYPSNEKSSAVEFFAPTFERLLCGINGSVAQFVAQRR